MNHTIWKAKRILHRNVMRMQERWLRLSLCSTIFCATEANGPSMRLSALGKVNLSPTGSVFCDTRSLCQLQAGFEIGRTQLVGPLLTRDFF